MIVSRVNGMKFCVKMKRTLSVLKKGKPFLTHDFMRDVEKHKESVISSRTRDGSTKRLWSQLISLEGENELYQKRNFRHSTTASGKINVRKWQKAFIWQRMDIFSIRFHFFSLNDFYFILLFVLEHKFTSSLPSWYSRDTFHVELNSSLHFRKLIKNL